jgi:hypothetical protein
MASPTGHLPVLEGKSDTAQIEDTTKEPHPNGTEMAEPTTRSTEEVAAPNSTTALSTAVATGEGKEQPIVALSRPRFFAIFISQLVSIFRE